jgi:hypothetical protein
VGAGRDVEWEWRTDIYAQAQGDEAMTTAWLRKGWVVGGSGQGSGLDCWGRRRAPAEVAVDCGWILSRFHPPSFFSFYYIYTTSILNISRTNKLICF